ncbi:hypothetical protein [Burkholderia sp. WSM2230]|uniref:hypothetical protein n=1 Tax=Burkholderia sp. WSM2230 TaxID=944435 RepID=UPI0003F59723|nr:hypothetical protein [Burkholderia sp. WSM2230]
MTSRHAETGAFAGKVAMITGAASGGDRIPRIGKGRFIVGAVVMADGGMSVALP